MTKVSVFRIMNSVLFYIYIIIHHRTAQPQLGWWPSSPWWWRDWGRRGPGSASGRKTSLPFIPVFFIIVIISNFEYTIPVFNTATFILLFPVKRKAYSIYLWYSM